MQYLVVIDTNVLVSALLAKHSDVATVKVLNAVYDGRIVPLYNQEIIEEYREVLGRTKFHFSREFVRIMIQAISDHGIMVDRLMTSDELPDPKDLVFYEVCMAKRDEDSMLVTGNMRHFPAKPYIVTPKELIDIIDLMKTD